MAKKKGFITALYERLSRDDEQFGDSVSILNQRLCLRIMQRSMAMRTSDTIPMMDTAAVLLNAPAGRK